MSIRIEVKLKENVRDVVGEHTLKRIKEELGLEVSLCRFVECYNIDGELSEEEIAKLGGEVFTDSVIQEYSTKGFFRDKLRVEVGFLPGLTDNVGNTASQGIEMTLGKKLPVYYSRIYVFDGNISSEDIQKIASFLHNPVIEKTKIHLPGEEIKPYIPKVILKHQPEVEKISLNISDNSLVQLSKERLLALSLEEMKAIKKYFRRKKVIEERKKVGLDERITDVELEAIAQTWSEHCKHKIFNAEIIYYDEKGEKHRINSLFSTFIRAATEEIRKPYVVSVFKDNGGIIRFDGKNNICVKVETHNAPCALDPYGGALTGILGVNRDILGTGLGAKPIANMDVLCFGPQEPKALPEGVLHPKSVYFGVIKGIEHGGNKSGIPTVNGSITFEECYLTRPVVYCGTVGILPAEIDGRPTHIKEIKPGYLAVMVGGRIGKDGIHGATFSSQQIDEHTPQSVVQIGDPITQKKMLDFILEARDLRLFEAITDNGAGGLSSSIGEMAQLSGGCEIYLDTCPLKYPGLDPWEILISESQERMTLAVPPDKLKALELLAKKHGVEITPVGKFTDSGKFHVLFQGKTVAYLDMDFLHDGLPQMKLKAVWKPLIFPEPDIRERDLRKILLHLLAAPNIRSKEWVIRQYDHEVQGGSVIKPLMAGPSDAAVIRPVLESEAGLVVSHGICPRIIHDSYLMATLAFDEAVRNALATGAKFGYLAALDNFSWPDPIQSKKTPDGEYKLAQLVRANHGLYDSSVRYGIPFISGKDSMKNDFYAKDRKYSISPTLLVTIVGKIDNINKAKTIDFKNPNDWIYVIGYTREELGGSEYYKLFKGIGNNPPKVRFEEIIPVYQSFSRVMEEGILQSAHDVSDGGLAVALAESSFSGGLGVDVDINNIPADTENEDALLFSETPGRFIVSVSPEKAQLFEKMMRGRPIARIGRVRGDKRFIIRKGEHILINEDIFSLERAWSKGIIFE